VSPWWVLANVSETFVGGDQKLSVLLDSVPKDGILGSSQFLFEDGAALIAPIPQELSYFSWKVLVDLDVHRSSGSERRHQLVAEDIGGIG